MGIFDNFSIPLSFLKKNNISRLPSPKDDLIVSGNSIKCSTIPYKTLASFDLELTKTRYSGDIPDATIKFYPID